jgi:uncharacterized protein YjbJ (UPF0337 family)
MLDQQTKQKFQEKFEQIKPQLKQQFSGLTDQDFAPEPDQLVQKISQKTGQSSQDVEQKLKTLVA